MNKDKLVRLFEESFGTVGVRNLLSVHAPGRSEIAGNHTDHEGGHVIAAALDVAVDCIAANNGTATVRVASEGYPQIEVDLDSLDSRDDEKGLTAALVRGMAYEVAVRGGTPTGFDLAMTSTIPSGGGLSSSAAVEAALGRALEAFWGLEPASPIALAQESQRTENNFYGKPCGLMDQAAVCLGGLAFMDFGNAANPRTQKVALDFEDFGHALVLIKVGADHAASTADYAAIPSEMQSVATKLGHTRLCEVDRSDFDRRIADLRQEYGDRAVLRCVHYWFENDLVDRRWEALQIGDIDAFLNLTRASGASSAMYLQNVAAELGREQPAMCALGLAEHILNGRGAARIHGGGFGGTIQAFVPLDIVDAFIAQMDAWLGVGSSRRYKVSDKGAYAAWL
jgi:galactokinase